MVLYFHGSGGKGRFSSVSEVTRLQAGRTGARIPEGTRFFRFSKTCRPSPVSTHHPSDMVPGIKRPGLEVDRSLPSDAEVKNECTYATPRVCLCDVDGDKFYG